MNYFGCHETENPMAGTDTKQGHKEFTGRLHKKNRAHE